MFEALRLIGSDEQGIPLNTRRNRPIGNAQAPETLDGRLCRKYDLLLAQHGDRWEQRKPPCGVYNCFGHVWASRRTAIYEQTEIDKILEDDGYRLLLDSELPMQGDLILYYVDGSLWHVGLVCELRALSLPTGMATAQRTAWVLSKWDNSSGEVLHDWQDVPFGGWHARFRTDRP